MFSLDYFSLQARIRFEYLLEKCLNKVVYIHPKVHERYQVVESRTKVYVDQEVSSHIV